MSEEITLFEEIIKYLDYATIIFAFLAMFGAFYNIYNFKKRLEKVEIYFNDEKLAIPLIRKECTRAEILGLLGIFRKDMSKQFHIEFMGTLSYLNLIMDIQKNKIDTLKIEITNKELEQFKDEIYKTNN
ncbi:hypothetical protein ACNSOO_10220 [Aliarcobacter lanthieri]|uniref:hypothetical protein n=1 Tax=Aliarcobacter lanthieri TaxID=1355374 RepID=UPI003AACD9DD